MRSWAGPLTIGAFAVTAVTGILMFFHVQIGLVKVAHEWLSWLFVIGALAHLLVNWQAFLAYFRKPVAVGIIGVMCLLGAASFLPLGGAGGAGPGGGRGPVAALLQAMEQAPLAVVAQVAHRTPQAITAELKAQGIQVQHEQQTVAEIASANNQRSMDLLTRMLGSARPGAGARGGH
jgi:hypothetical protein